MDERIAHTTSVTPELTTRELTAQLADDGIRLVALTWVDNAGITRVKTVPIAELTRAVRHGVGMSPVFDVYLVDDSMTTSEHIGGPVGDLRLYPDLDRLVPLAAQSGWAWAPASRRTQDGENYVGCQRSFAGRMVEAAAGAGLDLTMAFEIEWFVGHDGPPEDPAPACVGPAYGMTRVIELSDYIRDVVDALRAERVVVEQFHPEYATGQLELSVAATDPVTAADTAVLVRQTIRAVSAAHGLRASFAPVVIAGGVGNGPHLHLSAWTAGANLFAGGSGPHGLTAHGEAILAGLLAHLPALSAIGAPGPTSHFRLQPQQWAGPYQCWGRENREAALRLVTGTTGTQATTANAEIKCVDGSANPYLVVGAIAAVATAAFNAGGHLPDEVTVDPATLPATEQPPRLPTSVSEACEALATDEVLMPALGEALAKAFLAVRRAETELFANSPPDEVVAATRWAY